MKSTEEGSNISSSSSSASAPSSSPITVVSETPSNRLSTSNIDTSASKRGNSTPPPVATNNKSNRASVDKRFFSSPPTVLSNTSTTTSPETPSKKGSSISQTIQSMRSKSSRSSSGSTGSASVGPAGGQGGSTSKVNSMRKSDKAAVQEELFAEFQPHKYQTIQSFRPEEVKELLAQHFQKLNNDSQMSPRPSNMPSEDGRRRFFHLRPGRTNTARSANSPDIFKRDSTELSDSPETEDSIGAGLRAFVSHKQENIYSARTSSNNVKNEEEQRAATDAKEKEKSKRLSRKDTYHLNNYSTNNDKDKAITELTDQLSRERRIYAEQLNKMRAKQKKLKAKMIAQQEKLDSLMLLIEAREHNVQSKLATTLEHVEVREHKQVSAPFDASLGSLFNSVTTEK